MTLTKDQEATNFKTLQHIHLVRKYLDIMIKELLDRGLLHDQSKLETPEVEAFTEETDNLSGLTYGSLEYSANLKKIEPTLVHHYARNRHHPQHFKSGIDDMNLVDLMEMFCDWAASCQRHKDGNLRKSIEINANRFNMSAQLVKIFENSMEILER